MRAVTRISATRIQKWEDCPRKWWYDEVRGLDGGATPAMDRGTRVHAEIENFLLTGQWHDRAPLDPNWEASRIARKGMEPWRDEDGNVQPAPLARIREHVIAGTARIEHNFDLGTRLGPITFNGQIDVRLDGEPRAIVDHKTSSNLKAYWHLDEMGIANNTQLLVYAAAGWGLDNIPERVHVSHIYYSTALPYACKVTAATVTRAKIEDKMEAVSKIIHLAYKAAMEQDPRAIEANGASCSKFGGCPHKNYCPDSPSAHVREINKIRESRGPEYQPMSLTSALFGGKPATPGTAAKSPVVAAPGRVNPPDGPDASTQAIDAMKLRIERIVKSTQTAPTSAFVAKLVEESPPFAGLALAGVRASVVESLTAFGQGLLSGPTATATPQAAQTKAAPSNPAENAIKVLEALMRSKTGSRVVPGLVKDLKLSASDVGAAVQHGIDTFDDFWTLGENEDGIEEVSLDAELDAYNVPEIRKAFGLPDLTVSAPAPEKPTEGREALLAELDAIEARLGVAKVMEIANALGVKRPRKCGDDKLSGLISELRSVDAPARSTATVPVFPETLHRAALDSVQDGSDDVVTTEIEQVRAWLSGQGVPEGSAGAVISDAVLRAFLASGADKGLWTVNGETVTFLESSTIAAIPATVDVPEETEETEESEFAAANRLIVSAWTGDEPQAGSDKDPRFTNLGAHIDQRDRAAAVLLGIAEDQNRPASERIMAAAAVLGSR